MVVEGGERRGWRRCKLSLKPEPGSDFMQGPAVASLLGDQTRSQLERLSLSDPLLSASLFFFARFHLRRPPNLHSWRGFRGRIKLRRDANRRWDGKESSPFVRRAHDELHATAACPTTQSIRPCQETKEGNAARRCRRCRWYSGRLSQTFVLMGAA